MLGKSLGSRDSKRGAQTFISAEDRGGVPAGLSQGRREEKLRSPVIKESPIQTGGREGSGSQSLPGL